MSILLVGYYGFDNAGDEILREKSIELLADCFPEESIVFGSKIKTFFNLFTSSKIVFGGGGLLQNETSTGSLIYYLSLIVLGRFFRKKILLLSQGIGPIAGNHLKKVTGFVVSLCHVVSVRDIASYEFIKPYCLHALLGVDLAFFNIKNLKKYGLKNYNKDGQLLINFRSGNAWELNKETLLKWVSFEEPVTYMIAQKDMDYTESAYKKDAFLMDLFNGKVQDETHIQNYSAVISMRYHGCVWAILNHMPCLALVYDEKVYQLAKQFNLPLIDLRTKQSFEEIDRLVRLFKRDLPVAVYDEAKNDGFFKNLSVSLVKATVV
jgi:polysaccharide pyruvyl transferase CsaB